MRILTEKKLQAITTEAYNRGLRVGRGLGRIEGYAEARNMGCVLGSKLEREIDEILRSKNV